MDALGRVYDPMYSEEGGNPHWITSLLPYLRYEMLVGKEQHSYVHRLVSPYHEEELATLPSNV